MNMFPRMDMSETVGPGETTRVEVAIVFSNYGKGELPSREEFEKLIEDQMAGELDDDGLHVIGVHVHDENCLVDEFHPFEL